MGCSASSSVSVKVSDERGAPLIPPSSIVASTTAPAANAGPAHDEEDYKSPIVWDDVPEVDRTPKKNRKVPPLLMTPTGKSGNTRIQQLLQSSNGATGTNGPDEDDDDSEPFEVPMPTPYPKRGRRVSIDRLK